MRSLTTNKLRTRPVSASKPASDAENKLAVRAVMVVVADRDDVVTAVADRVVVDRVVADRLPCTLTRSGD